MCSTETQLRSPCCGAAQSTGRGMPARSNRGACVLQLRQRSCRKHVLRSSPSPGKDPGVEAHVTYTWASLWLSQQRSRLQCRRPGFDWAGTVPEEEGEGGSTPVFWPGESHGQRSLVGCSYGCKSNYHSPD